MIDSIRLQAHLNNGQQEYIMCAAIYVNDHQHYVYKPYNIDTGVVYCGWRHPCILEIIPLEMRKPEYKKIQGFLTNKNRFLSRADSLIIAQESNQIKNPDQLIGGILTSEDLW